MYEEFFNLRSKPFSLLPDPDFLYLSGRHAIGLSLLEYSLTGQAGFCVITGEVGSGKTTLTRAFMNKIGREFTVGLISNTHNAIADVGAWALFAFGQKPHSSNPAEVYQELMAFLIAEYGAGRQCVLLVDEAQNLSIAALEELRLLSNINSGKDLLLQIILVGQPELLEKLKRPDLRQFAQRIAVSHHLVPFTFAETRSYIQHRLEVAGTTEPIFSSMAIGAIQYFSGGIPRLINSICDLSMVYAFADGAHVVTDDLVFRVIADRQLGGIAPFAHTETQDGAALREKIHSMVPGLPNPPVDLPAPATALTSPPELPADISAPARLPGDRFSAEAIESNRSAGRAKKAAPSANANANIEALPEPAASRPSISRIEKVDPRGDDLYFTDTETADLLLTAEVVALPSSASLNGRVSIHPVATDSAPQRRQDDLTAETPVATVGLSPSVVQTIESDVALGRAANHGSRYSGLDHEDSVFVRRNPGTIRPPRRSWWRRAFLGGS